MTALADRMMSQREFGDLVGIGESAVSDLMARGVLRPNLTGQAWLHAYCKHLREQAAGRAGALAEASAALKLEQRDEVAMRNAIKRREYAPVAVISQVLAKVGRQCAGILDGLVPGIRLRWPEVSSDQLKLVEAEVARARNLMAAMSMADLVDPDDAEAEG